MSTVLIVEDDKAISEALATRLSAAGYDVVPAYDAATAGMVARRGQPDLAIVDISLPGGDGFVVARRLGKMFDHRLPVIFITASKKPGLKQRAYELGAVGYFEKPYHSAELMAAIAAAA